jgi:succinoglycan biosynthesis transport protein ExoP
LIGLAAGVVYVLTAPALYKSTAQILIDRSVNRFFQANKILDEPAFDDTEAFSQVYVLSSESVILPVIRSMDLAHDPEFVGNLHDSGKNSSWGIRNLVKMAKGFVGMDVNPQVEPETALERIAIEKFLKQLTVDREGGSVIDVTFASEDSIKAARIVNGLVDAYLTAISEAKSRSTKMASQLLQDRLVELKQSFLDANRALQEFKETHDLAANGLRAAEQIPALNAQMINARAQLAQAKGRVDQIQQRMESEKEPGLIFADSQVILGLRSKYLELSARAAELAKLVGPDHLEVAKIHQEMDRTLSAMRDEERRLAGTYISAYEAARSQTDELAALMAKLTAESKKESQTQSVLHELEGKANSLGDLYNTMLEKFNALNQQPLNPVQDARIITRAAPQLRKSSNKSLLVLGGGVLAGLLCGAGGAVAREVASGVFRTNEQVKQDTGIYCVSVPTVETSGSQNASSAAGPNPILLEEYVLDAPHSRFTEAFRNIKALTDASQRTRGDKVIGVVSPVANVGKSTVVTNLATVMAASARTLVIDGDLHKRRLTATLEPDASEGLMEALDDPSRLAELVRKRPRSGLDFLPCVLPKRTPNAAELLGSPQMEQLLNVAREAYDYIFVECPPVLSVVDVKMMERFLDGYVFIIEWGLTKRRAIHEALEEFDATRERALCIVLNKMDPAALQMIEAHRGPYYGAYYET